MTTLVDSPLVLDVVIYEKINSYTKGRQLAWQKQITNHFYIARIIGVIEGVLPESIKIPCEIVSCSKNDQNADIVKFLRDKGLSGRLRRRYLREGEQLPKIPIDEEAVERFNKFMGRG